jgi:anti-anti-sigma factor
MGGGEASRRPGADLQVVDGSEVVIEIGDADVVSALRDLRWRLPVLLDSGPRTVVVDLSEMAQLSSATVAVLLWIKRRCRSRGVVVVLRRPSRRSVEVLRRTGLHGAIPVEPPPDLAGHRRGRAPRSGRGH